MRYQDHSFLNGTIFLFDKIKTAITKCHSDNNRTQQYGTEVQYLKQQPELMTCHVEATKHLQKVLELLTFKLNADLQPLDG